MQGDGNLVIRNNGLVWNSKTGAWIGYHTKLVMQDDGNLVIMGWKEEYCGKKIWFPIWCTQPNNSPDGRIISSEYQKNLVENTLLSVCSNQFIIKQHKGQQIKFEFFLQSEYETLFTLYKNGSKVLSANVDNKPQGIYMTGLNSSNYDMVWSFTVQNKAQRSGHFGWADDKLVVQPHDDNNNLQIFSYTPRDIQNATINVTAQ